MTDGKTTHGFSMNTVHPLVRAFSDATSSLPDYSVRAFSDETPSLPDYSVRALFWQIEICSGIYTVHFNCKYFTSLYFIYARADKDASSGFCL